jgi:hypothetical protein
MYNPKLAKDPWFITLLKKVGVTDRKTANVIVITAVVIILAVSFLSASSSLDATNEITVKNPPLETI